MREGGQEGARVGRMGERGQDEDRQDASESTKTGRTGSKRSERGRTIWLESEGARARYIIVFRSRRHRGTGIDTQPLSFPALTQARGLPLSHAHFEENGLILLKRLRLHLLELHERHEVDLHER
eukprot:1799810-Pleurochrysis_carterae.AAC.2